MTPDVEALVDEKRRQREERYRRKRERQAATRLVLKTRRDIGKAITHTTKLRGGRR